VARERQRKASQRVPGQHRSHRSSESQEAGIAALIAIAQAESNSSEYSLAPESITSPSRETSRHGTAREVRQPGAIPTVPAGVGYDTTRERPEGFFITPDTAPEGLSIRRSRWVTPTLLILFAVGTVALDPWIQPMTHIYGRWLCALTNVPYDTFSKQRTVAIRPLFILLVLLFSILAAGTWQRRLRLFVTTTLTFAVLVLGTDLVLTRLSLLGFAGPFGAQGNTLAGLDGLPALAMGIFTNAKLPPGVVVRAERRRPPSNLALLVAAVALSIAGLWATHHYYARQLAFVGKLPLLAGIESVIVGFFCILSITLYLLDLARRRTSRTLHETLLPVGIIVPARNEQGLIGDCIRAIDEACADYPAPCSVYVMENGSSDGTYDEALTAIQQARYVRGVLLQCEPKGKAYALNMALRHVTEDVVLRIDADTLVTRSVLFGLLRHFRDPSVGGASGMPLPRTQSSWICRMRAIEVYYQVGFKRTGYNAIDAIGVLPGALVAYRRRLLLRLNGFAEGVNGEDADMTIRVGRLGYKIVSDSSVRAYTEMPSTFGYLREQRMRWARGTYHMLARNRSGIVMGQGIRCVWMLPWAAFIMLRRLMIIPFAAGGLLLVLVSRSAISLDEVAAGGAIFLGVQLIQMVLCMVLMGQLRLAVSLPGYLVFRILVSFFALETLLSMVFVPSWQSPDGSEERAGDIGGGLMAEG
jgi:cellulose synthase/poly-beta-1,6-N-acetylglucosamine synthase-like glycosyltransferase